MAKRKVSPQSEARLTELQILVKSRILERIAAEFQSGELRAAETMYTKSDGTNYGMYQKSGDFSVVENIWDAVFTGQQRPELGGPSQIGGGSTKG